MNKTLGGKKPGELEAVNPELRMIRVDCRNEGGEYVPIAAFSNFSMHPNLTNEDTDELYNGDVTAYVEREVEWGIRNRYPSAADPIHAIANYTHGDITPEYAKDEKLGYAAMRRLGVMIGRKALELFISLEAGLSDDAVNPLPFQRGRRVQHTEHRRREPVRQAGDRAGDRRRRP